MLDLTQQSHNCSDDVVSRRDFIRAGAVSAAGLSLAAAGLGAGAENRRDSACIVLFLVGGPSHLDTWDPKPAAPSDVRGPFRPIQTNVPGLQLAETFPLMAQMAHRYAVVRSVHHDRSVMHEAGHQLMQTGRLSTGDVVHPHFGAVVSRLRGPRKNDVPPFVVLPRPIGNTGAADMDHGQSAGHLGDVYGPRLQTAKSSSEPRALRERYGRGSFGRSCLQARRCIERGARVVTVNAFDSLFDRITWDCHADYGALPSTLDDYKESLCPAFDRAYSALLEDLDQRGMLDTTLVVAMGEFGRTPNLNSRGGRDHWPGCWSILLAGGGIRGGQAVGASDKIGAEPRDRPVTPAEVVATIYARLRLDPRTTLAGPDGGAAPLADAAPIAKHVGRRSRPGAVAVEAALRPREKPGPIPTVPSQQEVTDADCALDRPSKDSMIHYRTFRNYDPPQIVELWNATFRARGAAHLSSPTDLDEHLLAKSFFDPKGLWLAEVDERLVGFALACALEASDAGSECAHTGVIALLGVHPDFRRRGIGTELLHGCERYLNERGAPLIYAGPNGSLCPVTLGIYGGSDCPGFLESEGDHLVPFFERQGYRPEQAQLVLQCDLEDDAKVVDVRFFEHRRRYALETRPASVRGMPLDVAGALAAVDLEESCLVDKTNDEVIAILQWWEMELLRSTWGKPAIGLLHVEVGEELHRRGLARFLLVRFLQHARDLCFSLAEAQVPRDNEAAIALFEGVGFAPVDEGLVFKRSDALG